MDYTDRYIADVTQYVRDVDHAGDSADDFTRKQQEAALAARRMALAANEAGDKAARAERQAAEAAKLYERAAKEAADATRMLARGGMEEAEAAKFQERAEKALERSVEAATRAMREGERADITATAAAMANAKAVDHQADQFRRLGRQSGASFRTMEKEGTSAFESVGSSGVGMAALIGAAIGALPVAAEVVGGAIAAGIGGGMIAAGLMATKGSKQVQAELTALKQHVTAELKDMSRPFVQTWTTALDEAGDVWDAFSSHLKDDFSILAPAASAFTRALGDGLIRLRPGMDSLAKGFAAVLRALSAGLPSALGSFGAGLQKIGDQLQKNPQDLADFINGLIKLGGALLGVVAKLMSVWHALLELGRSFSNFGSNLSNLVTRFNALIPILGASEKAQLAAAKAARDHEGAMRGAAAATSGIANAQSILQMRSQEAAGTFGHEAQFMQLASQSAKDLKMSLDALSGKELTSREAAAAYGQSIIAMNQALKENGRQHGFATAKGIANEQALTSLARAAQANAVAMRDDGKSAGQVGSYMEGARKRIISAAEGMGYNAKQARALADKLLGVRDAANKIPKRKDLTVHANVAQALAALNQVLALATAATAAGIRAGRAEGGYVGWAKGGPVGWDGAAQLAAGGYAQGFPVGGMVRGPGTATSDSIPAWLSNGEYVINAAATRAWRPVLDMINYGRSRPTASVTAGGGAAGGGVTVHLYVQGSVVTERNLVESVRKGLAGISALNPGTNGATIRRAP